MINKDETDATFREMTAATIAAEANDLLAKQVKRTKVWRAKFLADNGVEPTMHDLILKLMQEPSKKAHVMVAYGAALWKLTEEDL